MEFSHYKEFLKKEYPSAYEFLQDQTDSFLFFPEPLSLPPEILQQMQQVVKSLFQLKQREDYQKQISNPSPPPAAALKNQSHDAVLMAYDFHLKDGLLQLIEVNTNGAAFLLLNSFCQFQNQPYKKAKEALKKAFQMEWVKFNKGRSSSPPKKTVLIDKDPLFQKMALEFFMYKDFFQSMGWPFEICDSRSLSMDKNGRLRTSSGEEVDFIYNRSTDFYFKEHPELTHAYLNRACAISPHPREYYLLSDKNRLQDWFLQKDIYPELRAIKQHIPFVETLNPQNQNEIWQNRKKYFFKAPQGHGGKLAYRGASLTRKKFNQLCALKSLAQEYISPSSIQDSKGQKWKVDYRAYVYEDQIQQLTARCYRGQVTNFREQGSGFAILY